MNLGDFRVLKEDNSSYTIAHPKGKSMVIKKEGMSKKAHEKIKAMCSGGKMAEGGEVEQPEEIPQALSPVEPEQQPQVSDMLSPQMPQQQVPIGEAAPLMPKAPLQQPQVLPNMDNQVMPQQQMPAAANYDLVNKSLMDKKTSTLREGDILSQQSANEAKILADQQTAMAKQNEDFQKRVAEYNDRSKQLESAFMNKQIDPDRIFKNQSLGSKIGVGISMILGGIGAGLTHQPNAAADMIKNMIDRDVDAQKNDQSKAMNAWKMNREALGSDQAANLATQNQMLLATKAKLMQAAAQSGSQLALERAKQQAFDIDTLIGQHNQTLGLMSQGMGVNTQGQFSGEDPSVLVPQLIKDPGMQKAAFEEIGKAQNISKNGDEMIKAYDDAAKENTVLRTGAGLLRTPGSVMKLHQLMLPNFKNIDGTVRQAAMDETFHNLTPQPGDSDSKIAEKREAFRDWMRAESSAPVSRGHYIDLQKFRSTAMPVFASNPMVQQFMRDNPGIASEAQAAKILKAHGKL